MQISLGLSLTSLGGPVESAWSIADVPGAVVVYDPSNTASMWQDAAFSTAATADGDPVGGMKNLVSDNYHMTASGAARPVRRLSGGFWSIEGDGVDDMLTADPWPYSPTPYFAVCWSLTSWPASYPILVQNRGAGGDGRQPQIMTYNGSTTRILTYWSGATQMISYSATDLSTRGMLALEMWYDGTDATTVIPTGSVSTTGLIYNTQTIGSYLLGPTPFHGRIGGVYYGTEIPSAENRTKIQEWLAARGAT